MPRRWHQLGDEARASRRGRWQTSPVTEESSKETVKTIARGMPDVSGVTVVTNACVFYHHARLRALPGARHSLRPLIAEGGNSTANLARKRGEIAELWLWMGAV